MISVIVLDVDGPLLDTRRRHYQCYCDILRQCKLTPIPFREYWRLKRCRTDLVEVLSRSNGLHECDKFRTIWQQRIETRKYLALDRLQPRIKVILKGWEQIGIRILLATQRNHVNNLHWQLHRLGIAEWPDAIVVTGSGRSGAEKAQAIRPLLATEQKSTILWVGDTEVDIQAARVLGVKMCAVTCGLRNRRILDSEHPDILEKNISTLASRLCGT